MHPYDFFANNASGKQTDQTTQALSALEHSFPRIARELTIYWKCSNIDAYIDHLLLDDRGNRLGFPADVLEELMFLSGIRWYLSPLSNTPVDGSSVETFNFSGSRTSDHETAGQDAKAWVLS